MSKRFLVTENERKYIKNLYTINESYWDRLFGRPSVKDSAEDALKSQGFSHTSKDEDEEHIIFDGQKFYQDDIEYADPHDMGEIPRIEGDKLIIANPAWKL